MNNSWNLSRIMRLAVPGIGILLWSIVPALAHDTPPPPGDPVLDTMSDRIATLGIVALCGMGAFFGLRALISAYERRRHITLDAKAVQAGTGLTTAVLMLLLWHFNAPAPPPVLAAGHVDMPRHGGQIQAVGSSHVETALGKDGSVAVYLMGITETISAPIPAYDLWAKATSPDTSASILLHPARQRSDPAGQSSVFTGQVPSGLQGKPVTLALSLPLGGQNAPLRFAFSRGGDALPNVAAHDTAAVRVASAPLTPDQKKLYLTPGGAYTQADIVANGSTSPDIKFAGMMANHHLHPKKGTYTCPITMTQANPKFPWTVGGQKYLFCCPPCIAEFVKQAKTDPKNLKPPQSYIQG